MLLCFHLPLTGLVMQMDGQPFNTNGWGGVPYSLSVCVEKDKNNFCLQGETHFSLVHSVPPFGSRHITQVCGSWEMLRPNIKDVMYQLEVNTFKDGLLAANDHAGCGLMLARCVRSAICILMKTASSMTFSEFLVSVCQLIVNMPLLCLVLLISTMAACRLGEGGNITKGPVAMGLRLQETFGVGPLQVNIKRVPSSP